MESDFEPREMRVGLKRYIEDRVPISPAATSILDAFLRIDSRPPHADYSLRTDLCAFPAPHGVKRILECPRAVHGIALDLRAGATEAHAAFEIAEIADLKLQELGPCIDAKTDVGAESCHLSLAHFFALDRLPS